MGYRKIICWIIEYVCEITRLWYLENMITSKESGLFVLAFSIFTILDLLLYNDEMMTISEGF